MKDDPSGNLSKKIYREYRLHPLDAQSFCSYLGNCSDVAMRDNRQCLILRRTKKESILPIVTFQSSDKWVHFRIFTILTMTNEKCDIESLLIRFETDEGGLQTGSTGAHDFCHAQLCNSIDSSIKASTPSWLPDSQPSFPVDADDQISLVLCMLTSLYGGSEVRSTIDSSGDRTIRKHLNCVRALRNREEDSKN